MKKRIAVLGMVCVMLAGLFTGCAKDKEERQVYKPTLPTASEEAEIFVKPIEGLDEDFMKGMDISSVLSLEAAGVKYYNEKGEEEDLFKILADSGVNYIRVRVWNDPFDENGNGYGGGNCDVKVATEIGKRAADYGMKLLVDFHYSDFWADPAKQMCPKAWVDMDVLEKAAAIKEFTVKSLNDIIDGGADVGMVQIGNEINYGMAGEKGVINVANLLKSASEGVREVADNKKQDIKICVHYTQVDDAQGTLKKAANLEQYKVDYDVFGISYYPYWHGTVENMTNVLKQIKADYGKDTCIVETSYCYTDEDGDCSGNSVAGADCTIYPASVQGQASMIRDIMAAAKEAGALGVFYWEGAWVPVGSDYDSNKEKWLKYGAGWASSYAAGYDPNDAGQYWGGSSWDNQAFFDFSGKKLASLDVFKYVNYGATAPLTVLKYQDAKFEVELNTPLVMPEGVETVYNNPDEKTPTPVTWNADEVAAVDTSVAKEYVVNGKTADGTEVKAEIKVASFNYAKNPSFEEGEEPWTVTYPNGISCGDLQNKAGDAKSGDFSYHYWTDQGDVEFMLEQVIPAGTLTKTGEYSMSAYVQGGDMGSNADVYIYVKCGDTVTKSESVTLTGWVNWQKPQLIVNIPDASQDITIGIYVKGAAKGWGTVDDIEFCSMK